MTAGRLLLVAAAALLLQACASGRAVPRPFPGAAVPAPPAASAPPADAAPPATPPPPDTAAAPGERSGPELSLSVIATALDLRGIPYRPGGSDLSGFDCSGFVQYVFAQHGRALPREVRDQVRLGREVERDELRPGDLVFFDTERRGASHVGLVVDGEQFVHAPSSRGVVRVEKISVDYWTRRFVAARRLE